MMVTFINGPLHGTVHDIVERGQSCPDHNIAVTYKAFVSQEYLEDPKIWRHQYALYDLFSNEAHFDVIQTQLHAHAYKFNQRCFCAEPGL